MQFKVENLQKAEVWGEFLSVMLKKNTQHYSLLTEKLTSDMSEDDFLKVIQAYLMAREIFIENIETKNLEQSWNNVKNNNIEKSAQILSPIVYKYMNDEKLKNIPFAIYMSTYSSTIISSFDVKSLKPSNVESLQKNDGIKFITDKNVKNFTRYLQEISILEATGKYDFKNEIEILRNTKKKILNEQNALEGFSKFCSNSQDSSFMRK